MDDRFCKGRGFFRGSLAYVFRQPGGTLGKLCLQRSCVKLAAEASCWGMLWRGRW